MRFTFILACFLNFFMIIEMYGHGGEPCALSMDDSAGENYPFIENKGQWNNDVDYIVKWSSSVLRFYDDGLLMTLFHPDDLAVRSHNHVSRDKKPFDQLRGHNYKMSFLNSSDQVKINPIGRSDFYYNYLIGNDRSKHASHVRSYNSIRYENLYKDIHAIYYTHNGALKYDLKIRPGADPSVIQWTYNGVSDVFIAAGELHICTEINEVIEKAPVVYQFIKGKKIDVACIYVMKDGILSYEFPDGYDTNYELIIDPVLEFATLSGASDDNWGVTATFDDTGNLYAGSVTFNEGLRVDFPVTPGAFRTDPGDLDDINMVLSKFTSDGSSLDYATYLGGSEIDIPTSLIVNSRNELVVLGTTGSNDFPTNNQSIDQDFNGGTDATGSNLGYMMPFGTDIVLAIISADGSSLVGSTYMGGSDNEGYFREFYQNSNYGDELRQEIILDNADNIYVVSQTRSRNFPTTNGAFQEDFNGGETDAVVFKTNPVLTNLIWSTYVGGDDVDAGFGLRLDSSNRTIFCGVTNSSNFPINDNAYLTSINGWEGFVSRLSENGSSLERSSFIGSPENDAAYYLDLDADENVIIFGQTADRNYPISNGAYRNTGSGNYVHGLNSDLTTTVFSTLIGNGNGIGQRIVPSAFLVDVCDQIYVSGWFGQVNTQSTNFGHPLSADAEQRITNGSDFYLMVLDPFASGLLYGSYFGGETADEHVDGGTSRFDKQGIVYQAVCAGCNGASDFPTTPGAFSRVNNNETDNTQCNLGVFKFEFQFEGIEVDAIAGPVLSDCSPLTVDFTNFSRGARFYEWDFGNGDTSDERSPTYTFTEKGEYRVRMLAIPNSSCADPDSVIFNITVEGGTPPQFIETEKCPLETSRLVAPNRNDGATYTWRPVMSADSVITVMDAGTYIVRTVDGLCVQEDTFYVGLKMIDIDIVTDAEYNGFDISCFGFTDGAITANPLNGTDPLTVTWEDGSSALSRDNLGAGVYDIYIIDALECEGRDTIELIEPEGTLNTPLLTDIDCVGQSEGVIEMRPMGGVPEYQYRIDDGPWQDDPFFDIAEEGFYKVEFIDANGCSRDTTVFINQPDFIDVELFSLLGGKLLPLGDETRIFGVINLPNNRIDTIIWSVQDGVNCDTCLERIVSPTRSEFYTIYVESDEMCTDTAVIEIRVDRNKNVYFPNIFTPNGDGDNDMFTMFAKDGIVENIDRLLIFNRWGGKVYHGANFLPNDLSRGWDGLVSGKEAMLGVYAWMAEVTFIDGVQEVYKGDLTLVR